LKVHYEVNSEHYFENFLRRQLISMCWLFSGLFRSSVVATCFLYVTKPVYKVITFQYNSKVIYAMILIKSGA